MAEKECLGRKTVKMEGTSVCLSGASVAPPNQRKIVKEKRTKNQSKKQIRKEKTNKITKQKHNKSNILYLNLKVSWPSLSYLNRKVSEANNSLAQPE